MRPKRRSAEIGMWFQVNGFNRFGVYDVFLHRDGSVSVYVMYKLTPEFVHKLKDNFNYRGYAKAHEYTHPQRAGVVVDTYAYRFDIESGD